MPYTFNPFTGNFDFFKANPNVGDIDSSSYTIPAETGTPVSITGLLFDATDTHSFKIQAKIDIDATTDLSGEYTLSGYYDGATWNISAPEIVGDDCDIIFNITAGGQVQYTTGTYAGFVAGTIRFRASTLNAQEK